jgi:hypothetical protein
VQPEEVLEMKRRNARTWLPVIIAALIAAGLPASAGANLLVNPGFEDAGGSYNGWTIYGNAPSISTPATDNIARTGSAAAKVFGEFTGCPIPNFDSGGVGQSFAPTPGQIYEFSGYSYVSSGDPLTGSFLCASNRCVAKIVFYDAPSGGAEMCSNEILVAGPSTPTDTWSPFSVSVPAPAGAQRVESLILFLQPGCDSGSTFVDDLMFREKTPPAPLPNALVNPSFDVFLTGWTTFDNVFAETRSFAIRTAPGSAKMFGPFTTPGAASGMYQSFPATPGLDWQLMVYSFITCQESPIEPGGQNYATAKIVFRDGGGAEVGFAETVIADANSPFGTWTQHSVAATAPAEAATAEAYLLFVQPDSTENGAVWVDDVVFREGELTDAPVLAADTRDFALRQNFPNPFRHSTHIDFVLAKPAPVKLSIYDVAGRHVRTLGEGHFTSGPHGFTWDGKAADGKAVATGVYRYVLRTPFGQTSRSMLRLR